MSSEISSDSELVTWPRSGAWSDDLSSAVEEERKKEEERSRGKGLVALWFREARVTGVRRILNPDRAGLLVSRS